MPSRGAEKQVSESSFDRPIANLPRAELVSNVATSAMPAITVGVLALHGAWVEHMSKVKEAAQSIAEDGAGRGEAIQWTAISVRGPHDLARCDALLIPGGESTTMGKLAEELGLLEPLRKFVQTDKKPVWGTCAGLILLADSVTGMQKGGQNLIGGLDICARRNSYGTQAQSFEAELDVDKAFATCLDAPLFLAPHPLAGRSIFRGVFVRAPVVDEVGDDVVKEIVLSRSGRLSGEKVQADVVAVSQGNIFATTFHPELTDDFRLHKFWLLSARRAVIQRGLP